MDSCTSSIHKPSNREKTQWPLYPSRVALGYLPKQTLLYQYTTSTTPLSPTNTKPTAPISTSRKHLHHTRNPTTPPILTLPLPPKIPIPPAPDLRRTSRAASDAPRHLHSLTHEADSIARSCLGSYAEESLDSGGHAQTEAGEEGGQGAAGDEGHKDEEEDFEGVALGVLDEVAEELLEFFVGAMNEAFARGAFVVGGAAFRRRLC